MVLKQEAGSLKTRIYNNLKEKIMFCELLPGSNLSESELCAEYSVSRTPVREALLELEKEGYVVIEPRKSTRVSKVSLHELKYLNEARILIEASVLRSLAMPLSNADGKMLEEFRERLKRLDPSGEMQGKYKFFLQLDYEFHTMLTSLGGNPLLIRFAEEMLQRSARQWYLMYLTIERRLAVSNEEHIGILDRLLEGNPGAAADLLETHIGAFQNLQYFE